MNSQPRRAASPPHEKCPGCLCVQFSDCRVHKSSQQHFIDQRHLYPDLVEKNPTKSRVARRGKDIRLDCEESSFRCLHAKHEDNNKIIALNYCTEGAIRGTALLSRLFNKQWSPADTPSCVFFYLAPSLLHRRLSMPTVLKAGSIEGRECDNGG